MLFTLLNWLYILITCYICGYFSLTRIYKGRVSADGCIMSGIVVLTAYSEYFSLFGGVGLIANLFLIAVCLAFVYIDRDKYRHDLKSCFGIHDKNKADRLTIIVTMAISASVTLICAYFTASSAFTYDTGTYHAQSIHWIESYGVVKGLAHMQTRLGFNNSYFALCALFSFHFLGHSMHTVSGFLAAFVMVGSIHTYADHIYEFRKKMHARKIVDILSYVRMSDLVLPAPFAYFIITATEITSPSTDFGVIWMMLWLMIRWIGCMEDDVTKDGRINPGNGADNDRIAVLSLLSVFSVFLITVKLSVGILAAITLYPLFFLLRGKKYGDIAKYMLSGLALVLPFFIRNYLITGWLVYPFSAVDLFDPDWKVPLEGVRHEAEEIVVWARYTKDTALIDQGIREWFPVWWREQGEANRFLSISAFAGCLAILFSVISGCFFFINRSRKNRITEKESRPNRPMTGYMFTGCVLLLSFTFFMLSAPSNRFGYAYILILPLYGAGELILSAFPLFFAGSSDKGSGSISKAAYAIISAAVFILILYGLGRGVRMYASDDKTHAVNTGISGFIMAQRRYPEAECMSEEWEGMKIYYPVIEGDQIWYDAFPAILYRGNLEGTERRGDSVRDGFRLKQVKVDLL